MRSKHTTTDRYAHAAASESSPRDERDEAEETSGRAVTIAPTSEVRRASRPEAAAPRRVRVAMRTSVRDPCLFIVRLLAEDADPPPGTVEAYLLLPDVRDTLVDVGEYVPTTGGIAR
jgi:hypothetical protein